MFLKLKRSALCTALCTALFFNVTSTAVNAAGGDGPTEGYVAPYSMAPEGTTGLFRITLHDTAISRLGIETAEVTTTLANRTFIVGGYVVDKTPVGMVANVASTPTEGGIVTPQKWIAVPVTEETEDSIPSSVRIRVLNGDSATWIQATPDASLNTGLTTEQGGMIYYRIDGESSAFVPGEVVLVEVPFAGNGGEHITVPFSSVIYDRNGDEWVFVNPEPNVFLRATIDIAYIDGDRVLLKEGPAAGMRVVTVGAAELLGIEYKVGH